VSIAKQSGLRQKYRRKLSIVPTFFFENKKISIVGYVIDGCMCEWSSKAIEQ